MRRLRASVTRSRHRGFGLLTEIDVQVNLRGRRGEEMEEYLILGACNPLRRRVLALTAGSGCSPAMWSSGQETGQTVIEAADPRAKPGLTGRPSLQQVADDTAARLRAAPDFLPGNGETARHSPCALRRRGRWAQAARTKDPDMHDRCTCHWYPPGH
jgi:Domain of unknown function DUF302